MKNILEHCIIICSMVFLAFLALDYYNAKMNFAGNSLSRKMLFLFCVLSIINSIWGLRRKNGKDRLI